MYGAGHASSSQPAHYDRGRALMDGIAAKRMAEEIATARAALHAA